MVFEGYKMRLSHHATVWSALLFLLVFSNPSHAALGSLPMALAGTGAVAAMRYVTTANMVYTVTKSTLPNSTVVHEYVAANGKVFAVSWKGPFLPDFQDLLGQHFSTMLDEAGKAVKAGNSQLSVTLPELVLSSRGHLHAFEGQAWIPLDLPTGFKLGELH